jgi:hypothetical protein
MLAAATTSGALRSVDEEHPHLLQQRLRRLPPHQPHSTPAHEACRDRFDFVREHVAISDVRVLHVPTTSQFTDIFTKGLPNSVFSEFQYSLNIRSG